MSIIDTVDSEEAPPQAISAGEMHSIVLFPGRADSFDIETVRIVDEAFHWA
jgi:hypothetical protein